ncbi:MAG: DNRLRE domain-containing protein, partial [Planctomycetota bacterium]
MEEAGITQKAIDEINGSQYTSTIISDAAFQNTLEAIVATRTAPANATVITSNAELSQIQSGGTYLLQGDFTLNQRIMVPSNVSIYVDGSIYYEGTHTAPAVHQGENNTSAIFFLNGSDNVELIGINNARLHSTPNLNPTSPHASAVIIAGNANNVTVEGFEMHHVWEGVNTRFGTSNVLVKDNYIHDTLMRAVWFLGLTDGAAVHNFIDNPGVDGIDFDAYVADSVAYENVVIGAGRWAGFVEEGANNNFLVRGVAIMADLDNPNSGYQMGWADNGTSQNFVNNNPGLLTRDNYFLDNVVFRPSSFRDGGDYFSNENAGKGMTYFWGNRGYGAGRSTNLFEIAEWQNEIPTAGGAGNAVNGQQVLADLNELYNGFTGQVDAGVDVTMVLPHHTATLTATIDTQTSEEDLSVTWELLSGPDQVWFTDRQSLHTDVSLRSAGVYEIQVTVNDQGTLSSDTLTVTIESPTANMELQPVDDAYVESGTGYNESVLKVQAANPQRRSYLKFDLTGIDTFQFDSAILQVQVDGDAGNGEVVIREGIHSQWDEDSISGTTAPATTGVVDSAMGDFEIGDIVEFDVLSRLLPTERTFVLSQASGNDVWFASKESTNAEPPTLVLGTSETVDVSTGDFDADGDFDCNDADELVHAMNSTQYDIYYDVVVDGSVDLVDLQVWLSLAGAANLSEGSSYLFGDANLNGAVDISDFNIWNSNKFTSNAG